MDEQTYLYYLRRAHVKKWAVVGLLLLVILLVASWVYNRAFIEVSISQQSSINTEYEYTITKQGLDKSSKTKTTSPNFKKLVSHGSFEIDVLSNFGTFVGITKTGHFFQTTHVDAELKPENSREFVGNDLNNCVSYDGNLLYSYVCGGDINALKLHHPATNNDPTYVSTAPYTESNILNILHVANRDMVFLYNPNNENGPAYYAYPLTPDLKINNRVFFKDLNNKVVYKIEPYLDGFIAYSNDFSDIKYYENLTSGPADIATISPSSDDVTPLAVSNKERRFAVLFSSEQSDTHTNEEGGVQEPLSPGKSEVFIYNDISQSPNRYTLSKPYYSIQLCGEDKLCLLNSGGLDIYSITGNKLRLISSVPKVRSIKSYGEHLLAIKDNRVINLDLQSMNGYVSYSFGRYKSCGLYVVQNGYIVCVINQKGDSSALYIDSMKSDSDSIDSKLSSLLNSPDVDSISAYKSIIYISPNAGELEYRPELQGYGYNPEIVKIANDNIDKEITRLKIDRNKYQIITTLGSQ